MKFSILLLYLVLYVLTGSSQQLEWAKQMGGISHQNTYAFDLDKNKNSYVGGRFINQIDLDAGPGTTMASSVGGQDMFVSKLDSFGNPLWSYAFGDTSIDQIESIKSDDHLNVYITGVFFGSIDFDPGIGVQMLTTGDHSSAFVLKLDSLGQFVWVKSFSSNFGSSWGSDLDLDSAGNPIIIGNYGGTIDFDPGPSTSYMTCMSYGITFMVKLDVNGQFLWAKHLPCNHQNYSRSITINHNHIVIAGRFSGITDFDPGPGTNNLASLNNFNQDMFVLVLDNAGNFNYVKRWSGNDSIPFYITDIALNSHNDIYMTGGFRGQIDFNPDAGVYNMAATNNFPDLFLIKLDSSGNFTWSQKIGSIGADIGFSLSIDSFDNIYLGGYFSYWADFDPGPGNSVMVSSGQTDAFIAKYQSNGDFIWAHKFGGTNNDLVIKHGVDADGNVFMAGDFSLTSDFDPGPSTYNLTTTDAAYDVFISKWKFCGIKDTLHFNDCDSVSFLGNTYTQTGNYVKFLHTPQGCDSILFLDIHILHSDTAITQYACHSFTFNGQTQYTSGIYYDTLINSFGCDSIVKLQLNIGTEDTTTNTISACDYYYAQGQLFTSSGTYISNATNIYGCDSIDILHLTIHPSVSHSIFINSCNDSYFFNGQYLSVSGVYYDTLSTASGCDSLLILNLTINPLNNLVYINNGILTSSLTASNYQWIQCQPFAIISGANAASFQPTSNGSYAVIIQNETCLDTSACFNYTVLNTNTYTQFDGITIYPNPIQQTVYINIPNMNNEAVELRLLDITGCAVRNASKELDLHGSEITWQVDGLAPGYYVLEIWLNHNRRYVKSMIKE